jgi:hypothetical protein
MPGIWDYAAVTRPTAYGDDTTYRIGMDWLSGCATVQDWGCGTGYARKFRTGHYQGIDGSPSQFAAVVTDLRTYRPDPAPDGIFMRHVLEHNHDWPLILARAVQFFRQRMALILFTPLGEQTRIIGWTGDIPDIAFRRAAFDPWLRGLTVREQSHATGTQYGIEHVLLIERGSGPATAAAAAATPPAPAPAPGTPSTTPPAATGAG